jgi:thiol-disulfide isomerase/thioredoxin
LDRLVVGSRTYTNVTIVGVNTTDLFFTYDKGMSNAKLKYLEPELQARFRYDPEVAALVEQQQIEDEARYIAAMSAKMAADIAAQAEKAILAAKKAAATYEESLVDPYADTSFLGQPAPALEVEKWLDEKPVLEGKFVLINFWAPWSFASRRAIPALNDLQKKFAGRVVVVALTSDPEREVQEMPGTKIAFASAIDSKVRVASAVGVTSVPCLLLVDPKGVVRYQGHPAALSDAALEVLLSKFATEPGK